LHTLPQRPTLAEPFAAEAQLSADICTDELKAHVYRLASPEFLGRRGPGAARASQHIAEAFKALKLIPAFGNSYFQNIPWLLADDAVKNSFVGRNVGALLPGSDPILKDEWILIGAHFDHLGKVGDTLYPGADDNATGVAMLLEVAEHFALRPDRPKRSIMFVAFDQEEAALQGSTHFATDPPLPFATLKACLVADMLGRSMANVMDEYLFTMGSETAPQLRQLVEDVHPANGLKIGRLGADLVGSRSDYAPFRDRRIPFLFFSTGQHPDYHRSTDTPEKIDYDKLRRASQWIAALTDRLATDAVAPQWTADPPRLDMDEVETVLTLVTRALDHPQSSLSADHRDLVTTVRDRLKGIQDRGRITESERTWLLWTARRLLLTVF